MLPASDSDISFDWNGQNIRFKDWHSDALGIYEYTTRDQRYFFRFDLKKVRREVRMYILDSPSYGSRTGDFHRLSDSNGDYICVRSDLRPDNVPDALSWLVYWSEETAKFIDTGRAFS